MLDTPDAHARSRPRHTVLDRFGALSAPHPARVPADARGAAIELVAGKGIEGDRYMIGREQGFYSHKPEEGRQVTLFELRRCWR